MPTAKEVGFEAVEPWAVFKLDTGDTIKVKIVMNKIRQVFDDAGEIMRGPDGKPTYDLQMIPHIVCETKEDQNAPVTLPEPVKPPAI